MEFYVGVIDFNIWNMVQEGFEPPKEMIARFFQEIYDPMISRGNQT